MGRILIVDSDSDQRRCMALGLRLCDFEVAEAPGYDRGIAALQAGDVDLVLIDLMIPGGLGLQLAREVRQNHPNVDVVMTGGYSLSRGQLERVGLDPLAFVAKPYSMAELSRFVDERMRRGATPAVA